uniref:YTH domain-containing protein n=1 Tax=Mesocestoides corti TaxID=53468 RepID=A0A5K3FAS9_MESCO
MMSSISYDASAATVATGNAKAPNNVASLTAAAYLRGGVQHPVNPTPDNSFMYQYTAPPLSSSPSPYPSAARDRATQPANLPAPSYLEYAAAAAAHLPYYCPQYLQAAAAASVAAATAAQYTPVDAAAFLPPQPHSTPSTAINKDCSFNYQQVMSPQEQQQQHQQSGHYLNPSTVPLPSQDHLVSGTAVPPPLSSSRSTPSSSAATMNVQKRRFSSPPAGGSSEKQPTCQQNPVESAPPAASAPPVYGMSEPMAQPRCADGVVGSGESLYTAMLAAAADQRQHQQQQQQQQMQQLYAAAAAAAACYPPELQLYAAPRIPDPYWPGFSSASPRHLSWYSRGHQFTPPPPPPPPPTAREEQPTLQDCYYDLATAFHSMRLCGGGSGVPSERGTYSPIQYATEAAAAAWGYPTQSSSQTSSPFPTLYGALTTQHHLHGHQPAGPGLRLHQTEFDPEELARLCPGINPPELDPSLIWRTRYFVIKSNSTRHVMLSIQHGVWCSTLAGNDCLNRAYLSMQQNSTTSQFADSPNSAGAGGNGGGGGSASSGAPVPSGGVGWCRPGRVLLFFSVNTSGCFCGVAEMISPVDKTKQLDIWQDSRWRGAFKVRWIYAKNVPNRLLRHIQVESSENRAVTHLRDTNEILPASKGEEMLEIIHNN